MNSPKRGRPRKRNSLRERTSFTLDPRARQNLEELSKRNGESQSEALNKILLREIDLDSYKETNESLLRIILPLFHKKFSEICRRYKIKSLSFFGSITREDYDSASDVDILAEFEKDHRLSLFDQARVQEELEEIFERKVDLLSKAALEKSSNPVKRKHILDNAVPFYVS